MPSLSPSSRPVRRTVDAAQRRRPATGFSPSSRPVGRTTDTAQPRPPATELVCVQRSGPAAFMRSHLWICKVVGVSPNAPDRGPGVRCAAACGLTAPGPLPQGGTPPDTSATSMHNVSCARLTLQDDIVTASPTAGAGPTDWDRPRVVIAVASSASTDTYSPPATSPSHDSSHIGLRRNSFSKVCSIRPVSSRCIMQARMQPLAPQTA